MTIGWKAVEQYFTVVLFVFKSYEFCNFRKFINIGLGTVRSERVKKIQMNKTLKITLISFKVC